MKAENGGSHRWTRMSMDFLGGTVDCADERGLRRRLGGGRRARQRRTGRTAATEEWTGGTRWTGLDGDGKDEGGRRKDENRERWEPQMDTEEHGFFGRDRRLRR
jgi:hypothetical protein